MFWPGERGDLFANAGCPCTSLEKEFLMKFLLSEYLNFHEIQRLYWSKALERIYRQWIWSLHEKIKLTLQVRDGNSEPRHSKPGWIICWRLKIVIRKWPGWLHNVCWLITYTRPCVKWCTMYSSAADFYVLNSCLCFVRHMTFKKNCNFMKIINFFYCRKMYGGPGWKCITPSKNLVLATGLLLCVIDWEI